MISTRVPSHFKRSIPAGYGSVKFRCESPPYEERYERGRVMAGKNAPKVLGLRTRNSKKFQFRNDQLNTGSCLKIRHFPHSFCSYFLSTLLSISTTSWFCRVVRSTVVLSHFIVFDTTVAQTNCAIWILGSYR